MKITAFRPLIVTSKSAEVISLFEELGFERRHTKTGITEDNATTVAMKDPNGFRISVTQVDQLPQEMTSIVVNVDNFDEALAILQEHGCTIIQGLKNDAVDTGSSKATMLVAPSGFTISLSQHIKK